MAHILHKRSSVSAKVPLVTDLLDGEISINTHDGRLFIKKTVNSVQSIVTLSNNYSDLINTPQDLQTSASPAFTNLSVTAATSSTSPSTGALTVSGGVGIGGALQVGGGLSVTNNGYTWAFNSVGKITLPPGGDIVNQSGVSVLFNNAPALGTPVSGNFSTGTFTWPTFNQNTTGTAAGLSSTLSVTKGGTGATSLAANGVILGNGLSAVQSVAPGSSGNILTSDGTTWTSQAAASVALPAQPSNTGKFLTTNGTNASWVPVTNLVPTATITSDYTAGINDLVRCDSVAGPIHITMPASPTDGTVIGIVDINNIAGTNNLIIYPSVGKTIERDLTSYILDISSAYVTFIYNSATANWQLLETPSAPATASASPASSANTIAMLIAYGG